MSSIRYTFVQRPDSRLATVIAGALANQRGDETRVIAASVLAAPAPTLVAHRSPTEPAYPAASSLPPTQLGGTAYAQPQGLDEFATVIMSRPIEGAAQGEKPAPLIRKSLPIGFVLHRYRIEGIIGEGGFGIAYRAVDTVINREVAIKELFLQGVCFRAHSNEIIVNGRPGEESLYRWAQYYFSEEARITFAMRHEGIVRIYDFFKTNNTAYIVYELLQGSDLQNWCNDRKDRLNHGQALELFRATALALQHVHQHGFVHRDVKPGNIFVAREGMKPILIDFGAASAIGRPPESGEVIVTPGFSPPEQYANTLPHDARTDIYALCATLYWTLTGRVPVDSRRRSAGEDIVPLRSAIDPAFRYGERLCRVVEQGMTLDARDRYDSIAALLDDLFPKTSLQATGYQAAPRGEKIFVSYRRDDSTHFTGRLLDFLEMRFGSGAVFVDVESIPAGIDFWDHIKEVLGGCAVMLIVMGPRWAETLAKRRRRWYQAFKKEDFVALEIEAALDLNVPIMPVLFDGAAMPKARALPRALRPVTMLNAAIIGPGPAFRSGADAVCEQVVRFRSSLSPDAA